MTAQPPSAAEAQLSRRGLLLGAIAITATACTPRPHPPAVDPDGAALGAARDTEHRLLASYDAAHPAYAAHLAHLHALGGALPPTLGPPTLGPPTLGPPTLGPPTLGPPTFGPATVGPSPSGPSASPSVPPVPSAAATAAERASVAELQAAANAAVRGADAALLASIAASHAVLGGATK